MRAVVELLLQVSLVKAMCRYIAAVCHVSPMLDGMRKSITQHHQGFLKISSVPLGLQLPVEC